MVDGVNNLSLAEITKLAMAKKGQGTSSAQKPAWMTQDGSIWNAPKLEAPKPKNINDLTSLDASKMTSKKECEQALSDIQNFTQGSPILNSMFKSKIQEITTKKNEFSIQESQQNLQNIAEGRSAETEETASSSGASKEGEQTKKAEDISASEGRAMAADMNKQTSDMKSQTAAVKKDGETANSYAKDAQKDEKTLQKEQKKLDKQYKKEEKSIKKNQQQIAKLTESLNAENEEVTALQSELQSLMSANSTGVGVNSAFSLSLAGTEEYQQDQQAMAEDPNAERIAELQGQISTKSASMQKTGKKIGKLQTSTNKQIKTMHKVTLKYMANVQNIQQVQETHKKASDNILEVTTKIEDGVTLFTTAATTVKYTGMALIALGSSTSWCFGAGAALIAAGQVMEKAGTVGETIGQYAQLAVNVTKTACYAAQGNIAGALTSAGAAVMAGTSAIKGSQEWGKSFAEIDDKATEATQKLAANVTAKETVSQMADSGALGNLTKKQAKNIAKAGAMEQLQGQTAETIKDSFKDGVGNIADKAKAGATAAVDSAVEATKGLSKEAIKEGIKKGTIQVAGNSSSLVKQAAQELKQEMNIDFKSFETWNKIGNGLQTAGAKMQAMNGGQKASGAGQKRTGYAPHYLTNPSKGYAMFAETQARRQKLMARHAA